MYVYLLSYIFFKSVLSRYGIVEGNLQKTRLFTISNPVLGSQSPAIVSKWCGKTYKQERTKNLAGSLSSLALSDNGQYLATGTMGGTIYILIAFSLQVNIMVVFFWFISSIASVMNQDKVQLCCSCHYTS